MKIAISYPRASGADNCNLDSDKNDDKSRDGRFHCSYADNAARLSQSMRADTLFFEDRRAK